MIDLLGWFRHEGEKLLAKRMVEQLIKNLPAKHFTERLDVLSAKKVSRHLEEIYGVAREYQAEQHMGMFRRAVLANTFRWELKTAGYPEDFIGVATEGLIVELTPAKKKPQ